MLTVRQTARLAAHMASRTRVVLIVLLMVKLMKRTPVLVRYDRFLVGNYQYVLCTEDELFRHLRISSVM